MRIHNLRMAAATTVALAVTLAGCGDNGGNSGSDNESEPLSRDEVRSALLTAEEIGPEYSEDADDDDSDADLGCISFVGDLDADDGAVQEAKAYASSGGEFEPSVETLVKSYDNTGDLSGKFDDIREDLDGCDSIDETVEDVTFELEITSDAEKTASDADDQINLVAVGTAASEGFEFPVDMRVSVVRIDNHMTAVAVSTFGEEDPGLINPLTEVATAKLAAVAAGKEPEAAAVVDPDDAPSGGVTEGAGAPEMLALDGGSYTWENGVTMNLSVERVEPWGHKSDFCGDGSCGIANPDDTRFVLKYEVVVPDDYPQPFDPSSCPGELHVTNGNDDEALGGVMGDYGSYLEGKIFPGAAKFGVDEYYIEKAYADAEFYLESYCGDPENYTESVYFTGPIEDLS